MTKKNPDIKSAPSVCSFVADYDAFQQFKNLVGDQNVSRELRAMIRDRIELQKNEQVHIDPLNLTTKISKGPLTNNTRQSTLYESFVHKDQRDELVKFVQSIADTSLLNTLETNAKCMLRVSETHRKKIVQLVTNA